MSNWYLFRNGQSNGPYPEEQVREWVKTGQIAPEEKLCREGDTNWMSLDMIPEFGADRPATGAAPAAAPSVAPAAPAAYGASPPKDKVVAGILAILLGYLGIHHFYLGNTGRALLYLLVSVLSVGTLAWIIWILALVDGILYLTKPDDQFQRNYKNWFCSGP